MVWISICAINIAMPCYCYKEPGSYRRGTAPLALD